MGEEAGDFLEFAHARSGHLFRTACLLSGDWHLAEDLVQETLAKLYRSWHRIDQQVGSPAAFAQTVLFRTFLSHRRRLSTRERPVDALPETPQPQEEPELRITLLQGLAQLTPKDRAVLVLRYWEDRSVEETAQVLRVSPGTARVRSLRALERLRAVLGEELQDLGVRTR
ncbi:SigE family RNA polymerase sigma factor [Kitasatospora sp. NPDC006697]|uniref:SigE family RNA polymerase sigma factor n=1 Tax=Kitasatospora sp. NPDC006697 TaxID=3364020 RepID=UPI0036B6397E